MSTNINSLLGFANQLTSSINAETRWIMEQEGTIQPGQNPVESLTSQSNSMVSDTMNMLEDLHNEMPDLVPLMQNNQYVPPALMGQTINNAMDTIAEIQARQAADPNWKGDLGAIASEELAVQRQQNELMRGLVTNLDTLNTNTTGLPQLLGNIANQSENTNTLIQAMSNSINSIQEMLLRLEQNLAANNAEEEAPVEEEPPAEEVPEE